MSAMEKWDEIYEGGEQINNAPFDEVVSFVLKHHPSHKSPPQIKIMEVGCGFGNNLKFFRSLGFETYGIDSSDTAVRGARVCCGDKRGDIRKGDFRFLPWQDDTFDMIIDRAALWYVDFDGAQQAIAEIHRTLKPGGKFLFTPCFYNTDQRTGTIRADTPETVRDLLPENKWKIHSMETVVIHDEMSGKIMSAHCRVVVEKRV